MPCEPSNLRNCTLVLVVDARTLKDIFTAARPQLQLRYQLQTTYARLQINDCPPAEQELIWQGSLEATSLGNSLVLLHSATCTGSMLSLFMCNSLLKIVRCRRPYPQQLGGRTSFNCPLLKLNISSLRPSADVA